MFRLLSWKPILLGVVVLGFGIKMGFDHWGKSRLEAKAASLGAEKAALMAHNAQYGKDSLKLKALLKLKDERLALQERLATERDAALRESREKAEAAENRHRKALDDVAAEKTANMTPKCPLGDASATIKALALIEGMRGC